MQESHAVALLLQPVVLFACVSASLVSICFLPQLLELPSFETLVSAILCGVAPALFAAWLQMSGTEFTAMCCVPLQEIWNVL